MINRRFLVCALLICAGRTIADQPHEQWTFRVSLNDKPIGTHEFVVERDGSRKWVRSEANFEYRLLSIKLFAYEHENTEIWRGDCLAEIESRTDSNGEPYRVRGRRNGNAFLVEDLRGTRTLPPCVMTFAYWDADFLDQERLLNSQNGAYLEVDVTGPEVVDLVVRGETRRALRYLLEADGIRLRLWYSTEKEWLGLESEVRGGRRLRYELL